MSPERHAAIRFLTAQVSKYREELRSWKGARALLRLGPAYARLTAYLQGLIADGVALLRRLKGRDGAGLAAREEPKSTSPEDNPAE